MKRSDPFCSFCGQQKRLNKGITELVPVDPKRFFLAMLIILTTYSVISFLLPIITDITFYPRSVDTQSIQFYFFVANIPLIISSLLLPIGLIIP